MDIQEIREGIKKILVQVRNDAIILERFDVSGYPPDNPYLNQILSYLAEKGACFPIEGELPISDWEETPASTVYHDGQMDLLKAGYKKVITLKEMLDASQK